LLPNFMCVTWHVAARQGNPQREAGDKVDA